jgi:hypothetical protein
MAIDTHRESHSTAIKDIKLPGRMDNGPSKGAEWPGSADLIRTPQAQVELPGQGNIFDVSRRVRQEAAAQW